MCGERSPERRAFALYKGDLLIWHSALVHGGMPRNDPALTRRSIVSHYTTREGYPYDRRDPNGTSHVLERNGGIYYGWRCQDHVEGRYPVAASV